MSLHLLESIGCSDPAEIHFSCPWRASTSAVKEIEWLFSPNASHLSGLNASTSPKLSISGYKLVIRNISSDDEGVYYCKILYTDGSMSSAQAAGCLLVQGK